MSPRNGYRLAAICFLAAFALRVGILFGTGLNLLQNRFEMLTVATAYARTGTLANAYMSMPTGPTAHVAPLYPILLGTLYRIFGEGQAGEDVRQTLACAVSSLRAGLLVLLALEFGLSEATAAAAGVFGMLYIGAYDTELKGDWEGPLAGAILLALVWWGYRAISRRTPGPLEAAGYGAAWGAALLVAPSLLPVGAGLAAVALGARWRRDRRRMAVALVCAGAAMAAALSPWIARNYAVLGGFVWGRDNFGLELSLSNGPDANWSNPRNSPRIYRTHPSRYRPEAEKLAAMGELAYNRARQEEAVRWIASQPGEFARLTVLRGFHFWFPPGKNAAHGGVLAGMTLLAWTGLGLLWRRQRGAFAVVAAIWATYPAMYYLIQWSSRYRLPMDWSLILCVAVTAGEAWRRSRREAAA